MEINMTLFNGLILLLFIVVSLIIGIRLILKYREEKNKNIITVGLTWIFLTSAWWDSIIIFFLVDLGGTVLSEQETILIALFTEPYISIAMLCWFYSFCVMIYPEWTKKGVLIYSIFAILYLIGLFFVYPIEHPVLTPFFYPFISILLLFFVFSFIITGYLFFNQTKKADNPKIIWKGRFLFIAFLSFSIGSILEIMFSMAAEIDDILVISRIILISSAIEYYLGFFIPDRLLKILTRE